MTSVKNSDIHWLGKVASDWEIAPAWRVMTERREKSLPDDVHLTPSQTHGVLTQQDYMDRTGNKVVLNLAGTDNMKRVRAGDFIIHLRSFQGGIEASAIDGKVSNAYTVLTPEPDAHFGYYRWFMKSVPLIEGLASSTDQLRDGQSINFSRFSRLSLPLPPLETQRRIADYLDRETAEIDAAVADLDKYVELLEQRRLFTVDEVLNSNEAVTSEWTEMSLKFVIRERFVGDWGGEPGTAEVDSVCVRVADFDRPTNTVNDQVPTTRSYSRAKYEAKRLQHHDILVERSGGGDKTPVGSAMLYTGGDEALCANFIEVVRLKEDQLPEYWVHILRREYMGRNTMRFVKQTTGIQNLDPQSFYDQKFPVTSLNEQHSLAEELRQRTSEIDSLIADSTRLRELLLKRRSVLITEVVTGRKQV